MISQLNLKEIEDLNKILALNGLCHRWPSDVKK